jgi:hypothetical protein
MASYKYKPQITETYSPRVTKRTYRLVGQICRRHEMFEADCLRLSLEAAIPAIVSRGGMAWLVRQLPGVGRNLGLPEMLTVRTSKRIREAINGLVKGSKGEFAEAQVLRLAYDFILPLAYAKGFAPIMAMRAKGL